MTRNVVVVVMDTARYQDVFPEDETVAPTLESLAAEGASFDRAIASAPWTLPSHASLFTGTYPSKHGAHAGHKHLGDDLATLAEAFAGADYETVAVSNNTWISDEFGFARGFERFRKTWQYLQADTDLGRVARTNEGREKLREVTRALFDGNPVVNALNAVYGQFVRKREDSGAHRTNEWIREWLADRDGERPFFCFVNYLEPHLEYRPSRETTERFLPEGTSYDEAMAVPQDAWSYVAGDLDLSGGDFEALRTLYRGEIAYLDDRIAELRDALEAADEWENTVFVVTGDHGENIGDHGLMDHQYALYETLLHVPLVIHGGPFAGGADDRLVSLTDLAPTLLDAVDVDAPAFREQAQGESLLDDDREEREHVFAEYLAPQPSMEALSERVGGLSEDVSRYDRRLRAVRGDDWKLIRGSDGSRECYHLGTDPTETVNRLSTDDEEGADDGLNERSIDATKQAETLDGALDDWLDSFDHADPESEATMSDGAAERLEDLGYLQE
ncbi:sulfatase [Halosimplex rubrum]|uniref:Sulfatase n=1 Tax=Halosimplex rubrum TaxID=869889 RepID=A0A7D5P306_9EURY|nr:sulfatase [Halosimplex rubrum]QLH76844.1 sulfatase [Halosimplex rubrum]